jgi:HK97 family phage major capsid protein
VPRNINIPARGAEGLNIPGDVDGGEPTDFSALDSFVRTGRIQASDIPLNVISAPVSGGAAASIPVSIQDSVLRTYLAVDPFRTVGATFLDTEGIGNLVWPIFSAGADFAQVGESVAVTDSAPPQIDSFTLGATKYSRLVKVSTETLKSMGQINAEPSTGNFDLSAEILAELMASIVNTWTKTATTQLLSDLDSNGTCVVLQGSDGYESLIRLVQAVPIRFASPTNKFMLSRDSLGVFRNARDLNHRPLLDPVANQLMGYGFAINDSLGERIVFGDWKSGAYVRRTGMELLRLIELYSQNGQIGFKLTQFFDQKFIASVHAVTNQPLVVLVGEVEGS